MERKTRYKFPCKGQQAHILDQDGIHPHAVQGKKVRYGIRNLTVLDEGIDRHIDLHAAKMGIPDCFTDVIFPEIGCEMPCSEPGTPKIYCIRPSRNGRKKCLSRSCRCEEFGDLSLLDFWRWMTHIPKRSLPGAD
ncbi:MAG: hypothetical protein A4E42_00290 [Methanoregulaceae archaeon PtaU1.Bin222]|nr:MAG: hypothetical protein A4E42_00290 [Methanoregulaceae archaeon PtaU1.Bin222]